jgi:uncharacterized YccA/Bax inhibitor family protein
MLNLQSSNPVIADSQLAGAAGTAAANPATVSGVATKTAISLALAIAGGIGGTALVKVGGQGALMGIWIASLVASLGAFFVTYRNPARAAWATPIYSVLQGAFLGSFALVLDSVLASRGIEAFGGLGLQAFVITAAMAASMLVIYRAGLIRANGTFVAVLSTLTLGIALVYLAQFVLSFFHIDIPGIGLQSALQGGKGAMWGLVINGVILVIASLWLIVDFQGVENAVQMRLGKEYEWYFAFGLMVTLVWIYLEALKLAFRAALANRR